MRKKFAVSPAQTLAMEFPDGTVREAAFTVESLLYLTEEFGDLTLVFEEEMIRPYDLAAKILYSGMKTFDTTVTLDEARAIAVGGGVVLMTEIFTMFAENFPELDSEDVKKNLIPAVNKMLTEVEE